MVMFIITSFTAGYRTPDKPLCVVCWSAGCEQQVFKDKVMKILDTVRVRGITMRRAPGRQEMCVEVVGEDLDDWVKLYC
jgi:hypothetical protein